MQSGRISPAAKMRKPSKLGRDGKKPSEIPKPVAETPSTLFIGITEILEVMTHPLPFALLSPLGSDLTSLYYLR